MGGWAIYNWYPTGAVGVVRSNKEDVPSLPSPPLLSHLVNVNAKLASSMMKGRQWHAPHSPHLAVYMIYYMYYAACIAGLILHMEQ